MQILFSIRGDVDEQQLIALGRFTFLVCNAHSLAEERKAMQIREE